MSSERPSLPERVKKGLREAIQHERGEIRTTHTRSASSGHSAHTNDEVEVEKGAAVFGV